MQITRRDFLKYVAADGRVSSHDTRLNDIIGLANLLGSSPEVVIYGVEPEEITAAIGLSEVVEAALPEVMRLVIQEARAGGSRDHAGHDPIPSAFLLETCSSTGQLPARPQTPRLLIQPPSKRREE